MRRASCARALAVMMLAAVAAGQEQRCTCEMGNASWLFLRSPKKAPGDPDPCPAVVKGVHPPAELPRLLVEEGCGGGTQDCFLRRHAISWRIACSVCATEPCCPAHKLKEPSFLDRDVLKLVAEQRKLAGDDVEAAMSPHFVVLTDMPRFAIRTVKGGTRWATRHEVLHVYLQRGEMARREFEAAFGAAHDSRSALFLAASEKTRKRVAQAYFGQTWTSLRRGYNSTGTIAGGRAQNGVCTVGKRDDDLHFRIRHWIGHILMSTYTGTSPMEKYLPRWLDAGCAHWLCRLHPRARDFSYFCLQEGSARGGGGRVTGGGSRWPTKARKIAARGPRKDPVEAMFTASSLDEMDYDMHVRAWSWFDFFLREEREPFVAFVRSLRAAQEPRAAAKAAWKETPESVDARWRDRILGRHAGEAEAEPDDDLTGIRNERDPDLLASRIRGLERCGELPAAKLLVKLADLRSSVRVREVIAMVLERTTDEEVLTFLRGDGFKNARDVGRAAICRALGKAKDEASVEMLRGALSDSFWLVRAEAARALARSGDTDSIPALTKQLDTSNGKVRIAAMDALAILKARAAVPAIAGNLTHRAWQVKVAACEALASIGDEAAVEPLIERIDLEGGRVHDEIRRALKTLTGMDRDWRAETWRKWWTKEKRYRELEKRSREALAEKKPKAPANDGYANQEKPPTYYGIKVFARTVGYVLDTSASMKQGFVVSDAWQRKLGRQYKERTRIGVSREELMHSLRSLDPRTRINLYFFNDRARAWQTVPVAVGSMRDNAISAARNTAATGQTNYYDALRLVLGLAEEGRGWNAAFADTPDTLFFLTDGLPTEGEITRGDELLSWFGEHNRFARLRVHVIAMGRAGVDEEFLKAFATRNGGTFVNLSGSH